MTHRIKIVYQRMVQRARGISQKQYNFTNAGSEKGGHQPLPNPGVCDIIQWLLCRGASADLGMHRWRRIEAVITGRTRNAFAREGTWVRIPPSPHKKKPCNHDGCRAFLISGDIR